MFGMNGFGTGVASSKTSARWKGWTKPLRGGTPNDRCTNYSAHPPLDDFVEGLIVQYFVRINQHEDETRSAFRPAIPDPSQAPLAQGAATQDHRCLCCTRIRAVWTITVSGPAFLWLILQHVLPKGFRRARNFGFLHPNSKRLIALLQVVLKGMPAPASAWMKPRPPLLCKCCGAPKRIVQRRLRPETRRQGDAGSVAGVIV